MIAPSMKLWSPSPSRLVSATGWMCPCAPQPVVHVDELLEHEEPEDGQRHDPGDADRDPSVLGELGQDVEQRIAEESPTAKLTRIDDTLEKPSCTIKMTIPTNAIALTMRTETIVWNQTEEDAASTG